MVQDDKPVMVYVTTATVDEARSLASALLVHKLIACGNILPKMESVYRWEGTVKQESEVVLLLKTTTSRVARIEEKVKEMHSYEVPCVVVLPIEGGSKDFLNWICDELDQETPRPDEPTY